MEVLNWAMLRENCGGDEALVDEVLELFRREAEGMVADVRKAVEKADAEAVKRSAHRLKGALVSLAAHSSVECARVLEAMGHHKDLAGAPGAMVALDAAVKSLLSALEVKQAR
ncbi:MAG: Hpt domain-containing protein [Archangium sp.]|nr:Hpt domain-containing protein [Archangium sp.]